MTFLGVPASVFAGVLAGLGATLFALHLLRIRLRRQTVDSLLFFRQVGAVHKPRVLLGRPARWLSFLLGLALLAAAWTAFADPRSTADGPSRVLLLDATVAARSTSADGERIDRALAARAIDLVGENELGPRGRVVAFGADTRTVWSPGDPLERLDERVAALRAGGPVSAVWGALGDAARASRPGDEIVVLGGPSELPDQVEGIPVRRAAAVPAGAAAAIVSARVVDTAEPRALRVELTTGVGPATVRAVRDGEVLAETRVDATSGEAAAAATSTVDLAPLPDGAVGALTIEVVPDVGATASASLAVGERRPTRVHVAAGLTDAVMVAVDADPRLERSALAEAEVAIVPAGTALPDALPAVVVDAGDAREGAGVAAPRVPRRTDSCPLPLGLRDRVRTDAPALEDDGGEVWVEDASTGAPLVSRRGDRIRTIAWLLDDATHRDVPALILGALHALADAPDADTGPLRAPAPAGAETAPALDERSGPWPWAAILLLLALAALGADAWLHHRGRVA